MKVEPTMGVDAATLAVNDGAVGAVLGRDGDVLAAEVDVDVARTGVGAVSDQYGVTI